MIILDTDHLNVLKYSNNATHRLLLRRMDQASDQAFVTTVITVEEQLRGWLAFIHKARDIHQQVPAYEQLGRLFDFFSRLTILPFTAQAADVFKTLRQQNVRIGTMDLKIASIAIVNDSLLLTANLRDFQKVKNLQVENWLTMPHE